MMTGTSCDTHDARWGNHFDLIQFPKVVFEIGVRLEWANAVYKHAAYVSVIESIIVSHFFIRTPLSWKSRPPIPTRSDARFGKWLSLSQNRRLRSDLETGS